jgi:hypothetical protein
VTWLLRAGLVAALAAQDSQYDLRDPLALGSATAPWVYGPGLALALSPSPEQAIHRLLQRTAF